MAAATKNPSWLAKLPQPWRYLLIGLTGMFGVGGTGWAAANYVLAHEAQASIQAPVQRLDAKIDTVRAESLERDSKLQSQVQTLETSTARITAFLERIDSRMESLDTSVRDLERYLREHPRSR